MKKLFCIVSAIIIGFVGSFLIILSVKTNTIAVFSDPYSINVYNKSTTTLNNKSYYEGDEIFNGVSKYLNDTLTISLFTLMIEEGKLKEKPIYGGSNYATYDTSMKQDNLVIEYIYKDTKNIVCFENGNSRVISFACLLLIIPCKAQYEEIVVYTSLNNDSTLKEEEYKQNKPFILKGNPEKLLEYVDSIK